MLNSLVAAVFLDRDGVINQELNYVHKVEDFQLIPGAVEGMKRLSDLGYKLIIVTNQGGLAKGIYSSLQYDVLTEHMLSLLKFNGVNISAIYHCPHHPDGTVHGLAVECECRKPKPGMLLRAAVDYHIDLSASVLVGDKTSDADAGRAAGVGRVVLVRTGHTIPPEGETHADICLIDLPAVAAWLEYLITNTK